MSKFYPVGSKFKTDDDEVYVLACTKFSEGLLISTESGNRWDDKPFKLEYVTERGWGLHEASLAEYTKPYEKGLGATTFTPVVLIQNIPTLTEFVETTQYKKPPKINFFRYVRPLDWIGQIEPRGGMALAFEIDYIKRIISVGVSICNDENFNRKIGRTISSVRLKNTDSSYHFEFPFLGAIGNEGTVNEFMDFLCEEIMNNDSKYNRKIMLKIMATIQSSY